MTTMTADAAPHPPTTTTTTSTSTSNNNNNSNDAAGHQHQKESNDTKPSNNNNKARKKQEDGRRRGRGPGPTTTRDSPPSSSSSSSYKYSVWDMISMLTLKDFFISVEQRSTWRQHLVFGKLNGKQLIQLFTTRLSTTTVLMTLLVGTQVATLFSPSDTTTKARSALENANVQTIEFWAGLTLMVGICLSLLSLVAIITAWVVMSAISPQNAHATLRSSLWMHASALPMQLAMLSIYVFVVALILFFFVICRWYVALPIVVVWLGLGLYVIALYSASAKIVVTTGAIGDHDSRRIIERNVEYQLSGRELTQMLFERALVAEEANIPIHEQYRTHYQDVLDAFIASKDKEQEQEKDHSNKSELLHDLLSRYRLPMEDYLGSEYGNNDNDDIGNNEIFRSNSASDLLSHHNNNNRRTRKRRQLLEERLSNDDDDDENHRSASSPGVATNHHGDDIDIEVGSNIHSHNNNSTKEE